MTFLLSPFARWLGGALLIVAIAASLYGMGRADGKAAAIAKIEAANAKALSKADAAERNVLSCPPGKWSREAGKCEP